MEYTEKELDKMSRKNGFRLRGMEMTRLETFIDAAFAFAITMLVIVVNDIPKNYIELVAAIKGVPAFAASFGLMMVFWSGHRKWSRCYGLEDGPSIFISLSLILVMLVYVYPLKLMFTALFSWITGGWLPSEFLVNAGSELIGLFYIYGFGVAAMAALMGLLFKRAKSVKEQLKLNPLEVLRTNEEIVIWFMVSIIGLASALFAIIMPLRVAYFAGFFYLVIPIAIPFLAIRFDKKARILQK